MAKRGEKRPWRVRYEWLENGVHDCSTFRSEEDARCFSDALRSNAEMCAMSLKVTIEHRGEPQQIIVSLAPSLEASPDDV